jgi:hypothetical protein
MSPSRTIPTPIIFIIPQAFQTFGIDFAQIPFHFSFYAFILSVLAMIFVSLLAKKTTEKVLDDTQTDWYLSKQ